MRKIEARVDADDARLVLEKGFLPPRIVNVVITAGFSPPVSLAKIEACIHGSALSSGEFKSICLPFLYPANVKITLFHPRNGYQKATCLGCYSERAGILAMNMLLTRMSAFQPGIQMFDLTVHNIVSSCDLCGAGIAPTKKARSNARDPRDGG